jgi:hypothetical protein
MRGARFLSFMLVLLSPFGALTASQAAAAPMAGPASEKLGTVAFANSCAPEAQESFERGVALLHSFAFAAGEKAFREALDRDPACAIATWGIATILIGNTFALGPSPESAERAAAAIERGRAIGAKSQRERDYIEAIAAFYDRFLERPQAARMRSLSDAFEALAARYKDDDETQIFSALYLTASQPLSDKTYARALKAAAILDAQFAKHPDHPGVAHYLIHAYDFPPIAQKGLPAALCYADIAPGAAHALHMPSHIFTRVGLWKESVETNARSAAAAKAENSIGQALHAMDYMVYADLQLARDADALAVVRDALGLSSPDIAAAYARAAIPARYAVERRQWREAAALPDPAAGKFPYIEPMTLFARPVGAARSGDPGAAEKDVARLAAYNGRNRPTDIPLRSPPISGRRRYYLNRSQINASAQETTALSAQKCMSYQFCHKRTGRPTRSSRRLPKRRSKPTLAVGRAPFALSGRQLIPELARDRLMLLVEPLAIISVLAHPNLGAVSQARFAEPIRIGERLARRAYDVADAARQIVFGHLEIVDAAGANNRHALAGVARGLANHRSRLGVAAERPALVGNVLRHAFVAARPGVRIGGGADRRLLGVIEFAAARGRQKVHSGAREGGTEDDRIAYVAAARYAFVGEKAAADGKARADAATNFGEHFERQPQPIFARAAIAIIARVGAREKRSHRVGVRVVELDAVKAGLLGTHCGIGEQTRQHLRQFANMRMLHVGDALAITELQRFQFMLG